MLGCFGAPLPVRLSGRRPQGRLRSDGSKERRISRVEIYLARLGAATGPAAGAGAVFFNRKRLQDALPLAQQLGRVQQDRQRRAGPWVHHGLDPAALVVEYGLGSGVETASRGGDLAQERVVVAVLR